MEEADRMYKESLSVYREVGDRHGEADAMANIGSIAHRLGDFKWPRGTIGTMCAWLTRLASNGRLVRR